MHRNWCKAHPTNDEVKMKRECEYKGNRKLNRESKHNDVRERLQQQHVPTAGDQSVLVEHLRRLVEYSQQNRQDAFSESLVTVRDLLAEENVSANLDRIAATMACRDALQLITACLSERERRSLQEDAVWIITNLARGPSEYVRVLVMQYAVVAHLLAILSDGASPFTLLDHVLGALSNVAADRDEYRRALLEPSCGLVAMLTAVVDRMQSDDDQSQSESYLSIADQMVHMIGILIQDSARDDDDMALLALACRLVTHASVMPDTYLEVCLCFERKLATAPSGPFIDWFVTLNFLNTVIDMLATPCSTYTLKTCLRILANLSRATPQQSKACLEAHPTLAPRLTRLASSANVDAICRKLACFIIGNMVGDTEYNVHAFTCAGVVDLVRTVLTNDTLAVKCEVVHIACNLLRALTRIESFAQHCSPQRNELACIMAGYMKHLESGTPKDEQHIRYVVDTGITKFIWF